LTKKTIHLIKTIIMLDMWLCDTQVELFDLTNVTNEIEINHLNMTNHDYIVIFFNVTIQKKIFNYFLNLITKK